LIAEKDHEACPRARTGIGIDANQLFDETADNATSEATRSFAAFAFPRRIHFGLASESMARLRLLGITFITTSNSGGLARFFSFLSARCRRDFEIFREVSPLRFESLSSRGYVREMRSRSSGSVFHISFPRACPVLVIHFRLTVICLPLSLFRQRLRSWQFLTRRRALFAIPSVALCRGETLSPSKIPVVSSARSTQRRPARLRP